MADYTQTTNYSLYKVNSGVKPWNVYVNANFDSIDTLIKALNDAVDLKLSNEDGSFNEYEEKDNYVGDDIVLIEDSVEDYTKKKITLDLILNKAKNYTDNVVATRYFLEPVLDKDLTSPPISPTDKDRYIVGASATGDWEGYDNQIAEYDADNSEWKFTDIKTGAFCWVLDESKLYRFTTSWGEFSSGSSGGGLPAMSITIDGNLYASAIAYRSFMWVVSSTTTRIDIDVSDAPTDATLIIDIHKNGVTIFTDQDHRPMILSGATSGYTTSIDVSDMANGDLFEIFVDQNGSTNTGANLKIRWWYSL